MLKPRFGQEATVTIEKLVYEGYGLTTLENFKIFVPNSLPGDVCVVRIVSVKRRHALADVVSITTPSPFRGKSACAQFPKCGGCQLIHVDYTGQLALKEKIFEDTVTRFFPELLPLIRPIAGSPTQTFHRNKMEFSFSKIDGRVVGGLKERGSFFRIVETPSCQLLSPTSNDILNWSADYFTKQDLSVLDTKTQTGTLRQLMVRESKRDQKQLLVLSVSDDVGQPLRHWVEDLAKQFPTVSGVLLRIHPAQGSKEPAKIIHLYGEDVLEENLCGMRFKLSSASFFQTNTAGANQLYQLIRTLADPQPDDVLMDLYCGTGTIGLTLAPYVQTLLGIEEIEVAVENARENATLNGIKNATFIAGNVKNILKFNSFSPSLVVVDPPRAGMVPKALTRILDLKAPKLIYVSCNPTTLLRDLKTAQDAGYKILTLQPVDMFPHTYHIECIAVLQKTCD